MQEFQFESDREEENKKIIKKISKPSIENSKETLRRSSKKSREVRNLYRTNQELISIGKDINLFKKY